MRAAPPAATVAIAAWLAAAALAEDQPPVSEFSGMRAWTVDSVLASAPFEGRKSGTRGGRMTESWIAERLAASGLLPAGEAGGFLQPFPVIGAAASRTKLELLDSPFGKIQFVHGDDYVLLLTPSQGKVAAEAVLVGYGIYAPQKGRDDYVGHDLVGKVAVILRGRPEDGQDWESEYRRTHTFTAARERGAAAVLFFQGGDPVAGAALAPEAYDPAIPAAYISQRIVKLLLRETGWTLEELQDSLKHGPVPLATGKRIRFQSKVEPRPGAQGSNVIGLLRGNDPRVDTEIVVIGAHHDHIGPVTEKLIYPGANDNASGTALIVEMARAASAAGWRPKRSVLFVTFGGEEMGLIGSRHFAAHPTCDSTRIVAMINIDMAGYGRGGFGVAGGAGLGPVYASWRDGLDSTRAAGLAEHRLGGEHSDYFPFLARGIPSVSCWSEGPHRRYHDLEDISRYIDPSGLESVGRGIFSLLVALADEESSLLDGMGRERILRSGGVQVSFEPVEASALADPDRRRFDGGGRIAGRLVLCDGRTKDPAEALAQIGRIREAAEGIEWLRTAGSFAAVEEIAGEGRAAALPVVLVGLLDRIGFHASRVVLASGVAGAILRDAGEPPGSTTLAALAAEERWLLLDGPVPWWGDLLAQGDSCRLVLRWRRSDLPGIPSAPGEVGKDQVLLILSPAGLEDSAAVRSALGIWGTERVHLDLSAGLEAPIADGETLRFLSWLRSLGFADDEMEGLLGKNLATF